MKRYWYGVKFSSVVPVDGTTKEEAIANAKEVLNKVPLIVDDMNINTVKGNEVQEE